MADHDHLFKLLLIGDSGCGKSSILLRYVDETFNEDLEATIGVDFKVKNLTINSKRLKLTCWDTAGQERFRTLTSSYYRGAHGVILVYDVTSRTSFENIDTWLQEVDTFTTFPDTVKLLVGNKIDKDGRQVSKREGAEYARQKGMLFLETSAKTTVGVSQAFEELCRKILDTESLLENTEVVELKPTSEEAGWCVCG